MATGTVHARLGRPRRNGDGVPALAGFRRVGFQREPVRPVPGSARALVGAGRLLGAHAGVQVGRNAVVRNAILDKDVVVPAGATIGVDRDRDRELYTVSDNGVVVIGKGRQIPL